MRNRYPHLTGLLNSENLKISDNSAEHHLVVSAAASYGDTAVPTRTIICINGYRY